MILWDVCVGGGRSGGGGLGREILNVNQHDTIGHWANLERLMKHVNKAEYLSFKIMRAYFSIAQTKLWQAKLG